MRRWKARKRHEDDIVLVGAEARLALGLKQADHLAGHVLDAEVLADRIDVTEQLVAHGLADDAGGPAAADLAVEELTSGRERPVLR